MKQDLLFEEKGQLGIITLNRARALNALTLSMIIAMQNQLLLWKKDPIVKAVVIRAVPGAAFCAGGDVRWLYELGSEQVEKQLEFFWHEYRLNHFIHHLGKPYIALMDGITMGGGVGISLHGSHRIATERFMFAMPETTIGFFPDIGSSFLLNRCPSYYGRYIGLTGNRLHSDQALYAGLISHVLPSDVLNLALEQLIQMDLSAHPYEQVDQCFDQYASHQTIEIPSLAGIMECFSHSSIEGILSALGQLENKGADEISVSLQKKSPFSIKLTLEQLIKSQGLTLAECLKMDFTLVQHFMRDKDFYEGVRALLIDKDKNPHWDPATLELVSATKIVNYFENKGPILEFI